MKLFYVTRNDKNGDSLTTSYDSQVKADKYGTGTDRKDWIGALYLDPNGGIPSKEKTDYIIRSKMVTNGDTPTSTGNFVLYTNTEDDTWEPTHHRFESYGLANSGMKNMLPTYHALMVVEEPKQKVVDDVPLSTEPAPF